MKKKKATIEEVLEVVEFLKDNMVSKHEFEDVVETIEFLKDNMVNKNELEEKFTEIKSEIMNHMDGFIGLHQKLDTELTALRSKYDRLESYVQQIAEHVNLQLHT